MSKDAPYEFGEAAADFVRALNNSAKFAVEVFSKEDKKAFKELLKTFEKAEKAESPEEQERALGKALLTGTPPKYLKGFEIGDEIDAEEETSLFPSYISLLEGSGPEIIQREFDAQLKSKPFTEWVERLSVT